MMYSSLRKINSSALTGVGRKLFAGNPEASRNFPRSIVWQDLRTSNTLDFATSTIAARNGSGFGQTAGAYRDLSNTNDPGGRIVEFQLRLNF